MSCGIENAAFYCQPWFGVLALLLLLVAACVVTYSSHEKIHKVIGFKPDEELINVLFNEEHPGTTYESTEPIEEAPPSKFLAWIAENNLPDGTNESILCRYFHLNEEWQVPFKLNT